MSCSRLANQACEYNNLVYLPHLFGLVSPSLSFLSASSPSPCIYFPFFVCVCLEEKKKEEEEEDFFYHHLSIRFV